MTGSTAETCAQRFGPQAAWVSSPDDCPLIPAPPPLRPEVPLDFTLHTGCPVFLRPLSFSDTTLSALVLVLGGFSLPVFHFPIPGAQLGLGGAPSLCMCVGGVGGSQDPMWLAWGSRGGGGAGSLPAQARQGSWSVYVVLVLSSQASNQPALALLRCWH